MNDASLYNREGDLLVPTPMTRGPWDSRFQHGGPPAALLAGAMAGFGDGGDFEMARITIELFKPVPITPVSVEVRPSKLGRAVQRLEATLTAGADTILVARGLRIRRAETAVPPVPSPEPWPDPEGLEDFVFPFFQDEVGYHKAVQLKVAQGVWGTTPIGVWARPRIPLIAGEATSPLQNLMLLADAQSGMGVPLDPMRYTFLNPDLTVYLERAPAPGWFGFDIRATANDQGGGLAQSSVRDARGLVARSAQSLVVVER